MTQFLYSLDVFIESATDLVDTAIPLHPAVAFRLLDFSAVLIRPAHQSKEPDNILFRAEKMLHQLSKSPMLLLFVDAPMNDRITILGSVCLDLSSIAEKAVAGGPGGSLRSTLKLFDAMQNVVGELQVYIRLSCVHDVVTRHLSLPPTVMHPQPLPQEILEGKDEIRTKKTDHLRESVVSRRTDASEAMHGAQEVCKQRLDNDEHAFEETEQQRRWRKPLATTGMSTDLTHEHNRKDPFTALLSDEPVVILKAPEIEQVVIPAKLEAILIRQSLTGKPREPIEDAFLPPALVFENSDLTNKSDLRDVRLHPKREQLLLSFRTVTPDDIPLYDKHPAYAAIAASRRVDVEEMNGEDQDLYPVSSPSPREHWERARLSHLGGGWKKERVANDIAGAASPKRTPQKSKPPGSKRPGCVMLPMGKVLAQRPKTAGGVQARTAPKPKPEWVTPRKESPPAKKRPQSAPFLKRRQGETILHAKANPVVQPAQVDATMFPTGQQKLLVPAQLVKQPSPVAAELSPSHPGYQPSPPKHVSGKPRQQSTAAFAKSSSPARRPLQRIIHNEGGADARGRRPVSAGVVRRERSVAREIFRDEPSQSPPRRRQSYSPPRKPQPFVSTSQEAMRMVNQAFPLPKRGTRIPKPSKLWMQKPRRSPLERERAEFLTPTKIPIRTQMTGTIIDYPHLDDSVIGDIEMQNVYLQQTQQVQEALIQQALMLKQQIDEQGYTLAQQEEQLKTALQFDETPVLPADDGDLQFPVHTLEELTSQIEQLSRQTELLMAGGEIVITDENHVPSSHVVRGTRTQLLQDRQRGERQRQALKKQREETTPPQAIYHKPVRTATNLRKQELELQWPSALPPGPAWWLNPRYKKKTK